jgi:hypothetical protein
MSERAGLERRYRRLLALYPRDHRRQHEEEMLGVLLADAHEGQRRPGFAESADLVIGALRIRMRMTPGSSRDSRWRDALSVVSVVVPLLLLGYVIAYSGVSGALLSAATSPLQLPSWSSYIASWPEWADGLVLTLLVLFRLRRSAALVAVIATATQVLFGLTGPSGSSGSAGDALWTFLGGLAAISLILSPGPARGLEILKWWRVVLLAVGSICLAALAQGNWYYVPGLSADDSVVLTAAIVGVTGLASLRSPVGRRVVALLTVPAVPFVLGSLGTFGGAGPLSPFLPPAVVALYLVPILIAALIVVLGRYSRRRAARQQTSS